MKSIPQPVFDQGWGFTLSADLLPEGEEGWALLEQTVMEGLYALCNATGGNVVAWVGTFRGLDALNQQAVLAGVVYTWQGGTELDDALTAVDQRFRARFHRVTNEGAQGPPEGFFPNVAFIDGELHLVFKDAVADADRPVVFYLERTGPGEVETHAHWMPELFEGFPTCSHVVFSDPRRAGAVSHGRLETAIQYAVCSMLLAARSREDIQPNLLRFLQAGLGARLAEYGFSTGGHLSIPALEAAVREAATELPKVLTKDSRIAVVQEVITAAMGGEPVTVMTGEEAKIFSWAFDTLGCA